MIRKIRLLLFLSALVPLQARPFHVVIDPGHGGVDGGTARDSFIESDIVFKIAELVKTNLEKSSPVRVSLTRSAHEGLSLLQRVNVANELHADLFMSLHANSSNSDAVSGMEFYFSAPPRSVPAVISHQNSNSIVQKIKEDLVQFGKIKSSLEFSKNIQQTTDQKSVIRRAPFYVIENTTMPSVLVEVGFISNRREARKLASPAYQAEIAELLAAAILKYQTKYEQNYKEKSDKNTALVEE
ncbi:MAG: N-acetylmuramoyl-L-alanine amidase [Bdellovibrionaceae bacterium]|nr:N-acetylmuramoyl-L-alanine amidase [Bdellovibrio sp.]